jgi:hypothetical protein
MVYRGILGSCRVRSPLSGAQTDDAAALRKRSHGRDAEDCGTQPRRHQDRTSAGIFFIGIGFFSFAVSSIVLASSVSAVQDAG